MTHFMISSETSRTMITGVDSHQHHGTLSPQVSTPWRNRHVHDKVHHPYPEMMKKREQAKKNSLGDMSNNTANTSNCTDGSDLSTSEELAFQEKYSLILGSGKGQERKNKKGSSSCQASPHCDDGRIDVSSRTKDVVDQPDTNHTHCSRREAKQRSRCCRQPIGPKLSPKRNEDDVNDSSSYSFRPTQNTNDDDNHDTESDHDPTLSKKEDSDHDPTLWKKDEKEVEDSKGDSTVEASSCISQQRCHRRMNVLVVVQDDSTEFSPQRCHRRTNVLSDINDVVDEPTTYHNNRGRRETHQRPRRTKPTNHRKMSL